MCTFQFSSHHKIHKITNYYFCLFSFAHTINIWSATHVPHAHTFAVVSRFAPQRTIQCGAGRYEPVHTQVCSQLYYFLWIQVLDQFNFNMVLYVDNAKNNARVNETLMSRIEEEPGTSVKCAGREHGFARNLGVYGVERGRLLPISNFRL